MLPPTVFLAFVLFGSAVGAVPGGPGAASTDVADFDGAGALAGWSVDSTAGAAGELTLGDGHAGRGAVLAYQLSAPGSAVSATLVLDEPIDGAALDLWLRTPVDAYVTAWVLDVNGRGFEYGLLRPFDALSPDSWFRPVVDLGAPLNAGEGPAPAPGAVSALGVVVHGIVPDTSGAIAVDEIVLRDVPTYRLSPFASAVSIDAGDVAASRSLTDRLGCNVHILHEGIQDRPEALDALCEAGYSRVRTDLTWELAEPEAGHYDFSPWDPVVDMLEARGLDVLFILCYGHPDHTDGLPPVSPEEREAFLDFAEAAVRHFSGRPVAFEVWNEPNTRLFWPPDANPAPFAALCRETIARIKSVDPSATVCTGGVTSHDYAYLASMIEHGAALGADAVGLHPYTERPEQLALYLPWVRRIVGPGTAADVQLWQTEWGYPSTGPDGGQTDEARLLQAVALSRELLLSWAAGFPIIVTYELIDGGRDGGDPEQNYGLLTSDLDRKPAFEAVETLRAVAHERRVRGFLHTPLSGLHALRVDGASDTVVALWSAAPGGEVVVDVPEGGSAVDVLGRTLAWPEEGGVVTLREEDGPAYVRYPRRPRRVSVRTSDR